MVSAAAEFRDRGVAALRRGENGKVILDQGLIYSAPKAVRVRMQAKDGSIKSISTVPSAVDADTASIEELILQGRNAIYEEELFHEIRREARMLANQGVRIVDSTVVINLPDKSPSVVIDLVPLGDATLVEDGRPHDGVGDGGGGGRDGRLAEGIALTLRLLLSNAHRQNLYRRSQPPPPLTERKRPLPPYALLRPVLGHLLHQSAVDSLRRLFKCLKDALQSAGLHARATLSVDIARPRIPSSALSSLSSAKSVMEEVIETFSSGQESSIQATWPGRTSLEVKIRTQASADPASFVLGTYYAVTYSSSSSSSSSSFTSSSSSSPRYRHKYEDKGVHVLSAPASIMRFSSQSELGRYLQHLTILSVVAEIKSLSPPSPTATHNVNGGGSGGGGLIRSLPCSNKWEASSSFNELTLTLPQFGRSRRLQVNVMTMPMPMPIPITDHEEGGAGGRGCGADGGDGGDGDDGLDQRGMTAVLEIHWSWMDETNVIPVSKPNLSGFIGSRSRRRGGGGGGGGGEGDGESSYYQWLGQFPSVPQHLHHHIDHLQTRRPLRDVVYRDVCRGK